MDKSCKISNLYVADLKALALIHQHNHWTNRGDEFYQFHLLFERLYNSTLENLDLAAEKFIGLFGDQALNYDLQADLLNKILIKYKDLEGSPVQMSLAAEKEFLKLSKSAYQDFQNEGTLSLGLDDMIMSIASKHEEAVYLLQQVLNETNDLK